MMILKKGILLIAMFALAICNFTMIADAKSNPYVYYGSIDSFVNKVNSYLSEDNKLYASWSGGHKDHYQYIGCFGQNGSYVSKVGSFPSNAFIINSNNTDYQVHDISISCGKKEDIKRFNRVLAATLIVIGLSDSEIEKFTNELSNSFRQLPYNKTFKIWCTKINRYIILKYEVSKYSYYKVEIKSKVS